MSDSQELRQLPIEAIRSTRAAYSSEETGLSYLRRMVQGPLDIVRREQQLRADGVVSDLASLVRSLPDVLADDGRARGAGRLTTVFGPRHVDPALEGELAAITEPLVGVSHLSDDELVAIVDELEAFERTVSARRLDLHRQIDVLQAELTRRYRTGEASVDALLS